MYKRPLPRILQEMNSVEVETFLASEAPVFLPLGTLEVHGRHLPVGTDTLCASKIAEDLSRIFDGAVAPSIGYGITHSLVQTSPGSHFPQDIYEQFVELVITNLHAQGFKTIVVINGHGGNMDALKNIARRVTKRLRIGLSVIHWWMLSTPLVEKCFSDKPGGHAAIEETAAMLHYCPTLVDPDNFNEKEDTYVPNNGIWMYPPPGEVLISEYGKGLPNFNCGTASDFMEAVLEDISSRLNAWLRSFNRIKGGQRP